MPKGIYKRTPVMQTGKFLRTLKHKVTNSIAMKKAGIKPPTRLGVKLTEKHKEKISISLKGKGNKWNKGKEMLPQTKEALRKARLGKPLSNEHRKKISESQKGEKSCHWKGGATNKNKTIRCSVEWKIWRESVFKRDNYICQQCKIKSSKGNRILLHPHHIKSFARYPELRFEIDNGITLCKKCHNVIHRRKNDNTGTGQGTS